MFNELEVKAADAASDILLDIVEKHERRCLCTMCVSFSLLYSVASKRPIMPYEVAMEPRRRVGRPLGK